MIRRASFSFTFSVLIPLWASCIFVPGAADPPNTSGTLWQQSPKPDGKENEGAKVKERPWERPSTFRHLILLPKGAPLKDAHLAPGYYDLETDSFYRWKAVAFDPKQAPYTGDYNRVLNLDPNKIKFNIVEYDPVVTYLKLESGKVAPGYNAPSKGFYRWKGTVIEMEEIPDEAAKEANRVLDPKRTIIEVDPPKHILDKTELWKKVKKEEKK